MWHGRVFSQQKAIGLLLEACWCLGLLVVTIQKSRFEHGLKTILVIEEKRGFIEDQIKSILFVSSERPEIVGKHDKQGQELIPTYGESTPALVAQAIALVFTIRS